MNSEEEKRKGEEKERDIVVKKRNAFILPISGEDDSAMELLLPTE